MQFRPTLDDGEPHRLLGLPGDDDTVVASEMKFWAEEAAGVRFAPDMSERREGAHAAPAGRRHSRADQRAGHKDKWVFRPQWISVAVHHIVDVARRQATAANEGAGVFLIQWFVPDIPRAEVNTQDFAHIAIHHSLLIYQLGATVTVNHPHVI